MVTHLLSDKAKEQILPRSLILTVNDVDVRKSSAEEVERLLHTSKLPVTLTLYKEVTRANLALLTDEGCWGMVQRDLEIKRKRERQQLERDECPDGWHTPPNVDSYQYHIFKTFEDESYSTLSRFIISSVMILIFISTIAYVLETVPKFTGLPIFNVIEYCVSIAFTIEYSIRIATCRNAWIYFWDYMNMIDFLAVIPFWIELSFKAQGGALLRVIRVIRLARVFRLLKTPRFKEYLDVIFGALKKSVPAFGLLGTLFVLDIIIFASLIFVAEKGKPNEYGVMVRPDDSESPFISIFAASWWCIVTMTCVGYGDMFPTTVEGQCIGIIAMFSGLLVIALPVIIIGGNFDTMYQKFRRKQKFKKRKLELEKLREQERKEMGDEMGIEPPITARTEDYFRAVNTYINSTCDGFTGYVVSFFNEEDVSFFVEHGYDTQEEIIEVLKKGPAGCYFFQMKYKGG
eukprot:UN24762